MEKVVMPFDYDRQYFSSDEGTFFRSCEDNAVRKLVERAMEKVYYNEPTIIPERYREGAIEWIDRANAIDAEKMKNWYHIIFGLPKDSTFEQEQKFVGDVDRLFGQTWILQGAYSFEKAAETLGEMGRCHVHLIAQVNLNPAKFRSRIMEMMHWNEREHRPLLRTQPMMTRTHVSNAAGYIRKNRPLDVDWRSALCVLPVTLCGSLTMDQLNDL